MSSWQQLLQQEAGVLISTSKRVRRKRIRTSPLSDTARRMLVSHCSLAGPDDSPTLAPVPESTEEVSVPGEEDSGGSSGGCSTVKQERERKGGRERLYDSG